MIQTETSEQSDAAAAAKAMRVGIQGYAGAFHEIAARYCFNGSPIEVVPAHTFEDLVRMVEQQEHADVGLMAIENTLAGSLMHNYKLLHESRLTVGGEVYLRIKQNLMALPGQRIEGLREVHSHPIAIAQCHAFFARYPHIRLVEAADTALSARNIREQGLEGVGAIASGLAAQLYGMEILAAGIETDKKNHTRFLLLQQQQEGGAERPAEKASLSFAVDHEVGSLYKVLAVLAAYNANLTKIQSAPIIGHPWEYRFFLDFVMEGSVGFAQAIEAIRPLTHDLRVMGVYPKGGHFEE